MHSFILLELLMIASASSTGTTPIGKAPGPKGPRTSSIVKGEKRAHEPSISDSTPFRSVTARRKMNTEMRTRTSLWLR
ncbi:hypothetical protein H4Q26_001981 [Puccinia striiformis f. sp. tritici PST-130]|nr:hypothetical protein H4Q26_001981 [Puccinia striiformis f. sp. tritici PST-130]